MQQRMKTNALSFEQVEELLRRAEVGRIVTQNPDGFPYAVPVHFIYYKEKIYIHGLPKGQKLNNIKQNPKVCFEVDEMIRILYDDNNVVCNTNTEYNSIIALGYAKIINEIEYKREVLNNIVGKYTPRYSGRILPDNMVKGVAVVEIEITDCTGKYYK